MKLNQAFTFRAWVCAMCLLMLTATTTNAARPATGDCTVVAAPCDNSWGSGINQTFAFLGIASPNLVQLYSYWAASKGCLNHTAASTSATSLSLSLATCSSSDSVMWYGPGAIQTYVYYNNSKGNCLSLRPNSSQPEMIGLGMAPCCYAAGQVCTEVELDMQMWLEPPTSKNPYSRISSKYTDSRNVPYCLTRVGTQC